MGVVVPRFSNLTRGPEGPKTGVSNNASTNGDFKEAFSDSGKRIRRSSDTPIPS